MNASLREVGEHIRGAVGKEGGIEPFLNQAVEKIIGKLRGNNTELKQRVRTAIKKKKLRPRNHTVRSNKATPIAVAPAVPETASLTPPTAVKPSLPATAAPKPPAAATKKVPVKRPKLPLPEPFFSSDLARDLYPAAKLRAADAINRFVSAGVRAPATMRAPATTAPRPPAAETAPPTGAETAPPTGAETARSVSIEALMIALADPATLLDVSLLRARIGEVQASVRAFESDRMGRLFAQLAAPSLRLSQRALGVLRAATTQLHSIAHPVAVALSASIALPAVAIAAPTSALLGLLSLATWRAADATLRGAFSASARSFISTRSLLYVRLQIATARATPSTPLAARRQLAEWRVALRLEVQAHCATWDSSAGFSRECGAFHALRTRYLLFRELHDATMLLDAALESDVVAVLIVRGALRAGDPAGSAGVRALRRCALLADGSVAEAPGRALHVFHACEAHGAWFDRALRGLVGGAVDEVKRLALPARLVAPELTGELQAWLLVDRQLIHLTTEDSPTARSVERALRAGSDSTPARSTARAD